MQRSLVLATAIWAAPTSAQTIPVLGMTAAGAAAAATGVELPGELKRSSYDFPIRAHLAGALFIFYGAAKHCIQRQIEKTAAVPHLTACRHRPSARPCPQVITDSPRGSFMKKKDSDFGGTPVFTAFVGFRHVCFGRRARAHALQRRDQRLHALNVAGGPYEMHGQWSMDLHQQWGTTDFTADFSADMTMAAITTALVTDATPPNATVSVHAQTGVGRTRTISR